MTASPYTRAEVEAHYLKCPHCPNSRSHLDTHECPTCGSVAVKVLWTAPAPTTPELMLIQGTNNRL